MDGNRTNNGVPLDQVPEQVETCEISKHCAELAKIQLQFGISYISLQLFLLTHSKPCIYYSRVWKILPLLDIWYIGAHIWCCVYFEYKTISQVWEINQPFCAVYQTRKQKSFLVKMLLMEQDTMRLQNKSHFLVLQVTSCWRICCLTWLRDQHQPGSSRCLPWLTPGAPSTWTTSTVRRNTTSRKPTLRASSPMSSSPALWRRGWKVCVYIQNLCHQKLFKNETVHFIICTPFIQSGYLLIFQALVWRHIPSTLESSRQIYGAIWVALSRPSWRSPVPSPKTQPRELRRPFTARWNHRWTKRAVDTTGTPQVWRVYRSPSTSDAMNVFLKV